MSTVMVCYATTDSKVENAKRVLNKLKEIRDSKVAPYFMIRRAIKRQQSIVDSLVTM